MNTDESSRTSIVHLPSRTNRASATATTHGAVIEVYENGLSFVDQVGLMRGYLSSGGFLGLVGVALGIYASVRLGSSWLILPQLFLFFIALLFIQIDWVGYRYEPVLFDRSSAKIHIFKSIGLPWWEWGWNIFGRPKSEVQSFDWDCVEAEVVSFTIFTGQIPRRECSLVLSIKNEPGGAVEIQRVGVGPTFGYGDTSGAIERWEYIRRLMERRGPVWTPDEYRFRDFGTGFWESVTIGQPLIGPGCGANWRKGPLVWILGLMALVAFPITAYAGMCRYISFRMKRRPTWPEIVKLSVGAGPFDDATATAIHMSNEGGRKSLK
ncbi:DUF6708 domain-containing protein [Stenotrophomonas terrae]|uniref:DUF6708 domain-containing protein n=1 Tax=Stenotrophomonas terrae TaxID=405446 RepID=UPI00320AF907